MDIQREEFELTFQKTSFCKNMVKSLENSDCPFTSVFEMRNGKYRSSYVQLSFEIWQAAKAQAVPEPSINMTGHDLKYIWDFMDYADPENLDTEVTIQLCKEGFDGAGLYAWVAEYPEEGGIKLGEAQEPAND